MFNYESSRNHSNLNSPKLEKHRKRLDFPDRKELSEDEILLAYNKLMDQKRFKEPKRKDELPSDLKEEFLLWMESKQKEQKLNQVNAPKVNNVEDVDESLNVVKSETEEISTKNMNAIDKTETEDFGEFKDVIEDDKEFLKVPLMIVEDDEVNEEKIDEKSQETSVELEETSKAESKIEETNVDEYTIDAKLTLSNAPLEVTTSLSTSSFSLASDKSSEEGSSRKRPATHTKGRAPQPPTIEVIPGQFFDTVTKKYFKETEL